jgi:serine/threonine protein kinase
MSSESPVGRTIGRYTLYGEIASGGMATVHFGRLAGPVGFSRTVAIKRLHEQYAKDPEFVSMFLDEARLAARIRHPNVVPTLDVVATAGQLFLVMEYVQGENLSQLIRAVARSDQQIPPRVVASILAGALHGLHAAHEATDERGEPLHMVHRDVSPQNVLVGTDGLTRVLDFGVAKAAGRMQTTQDGRLKGKFAYMAPEQIKRGPITRRTDVFSAAIVLWEALTAHRLFVGEGEADIMMSVLSGAIEAPSALRPDLGDRYDAVTMRGLERDPELRFESAHEMAVALEKCGEVATPSEVGEWLRSIAGDRLSARAAAVAEIESGVRPPTQGQLTAHLDESNSAALGEAITVLSDPPQMTRSISDVSALRPRRRRGALLALAVFLPLIVTSVWLLTRTPARNDPAPEPSNAGLALASTTGSPAALASAPISSVASASAKTTASARPSFKPVGTGAHKPGCSPPFTVDSLGHHHYKIECL